MAKVSTPTRYQELVQNNAKRRAIMQVGISRSDNARNFMVANINKTASLQVQTAEMQLRAKAQAAAKSRSAKLNKLV